MQAESTSGVAKSGKALAFFDESEHLHCHFELHVFESYRASGCAWLLQTSLNLRRASVMPLAA